MADKIDRPLDFLKEEMESDQIAVRVNAMTRTPIIAALIGNAAVEKDLVPYLDSLIAKEDDEVVYAISRQLGKYYPVLTKKFQVLIPLLENLCQFEETVVRDAAIQSIIEISEKITEEECISVIVPCILRLADGAWFTSKVSSIILMSAIYEKTGEYKTSLRKKFKELSGDETLMIRRAIASGIGKLSSKMKVDSFVQDMIPIVKVLMNDEQDTVRLVCLDSIVEMSKSFPKEMNKSMIIPILIPMIRDRAWKVRIKIANNFTKLAENMGQDIADNTLLSIFSSLLSDPEGEVRLGAAENFIGLMKFISKSKYPGLIPQFTELLKDSLPLVRVSGYDIFANIILSLPKEDIKQKVISVFLANFKTESDNEVKIMLLRAITCCGITLGAELLAIITNQDINNFLKEKSWRVRKEVYNLIIEVACHSRSNQLFEVHFQEFFLGCLNDPVYQIRMHGSVLLPRLLEIEPASWVSNVFIPRVQKLRVQEGSSTYLKRVTALYALEKLVLANPQALQSPCVQEILPELKEKVPNVRLVALKVLRSCYKLLDDSLKGNIKTAAAGLTSDSDPDVKAEALALSKC